MVALIVTGTHLITSGAQPVDQRIDPTGPSTPVPSSQMTAPTDRPANGATNGVFPRWDPFTITDEPWADSVLPHQLDPPANPPDVADDPMVAAVIAAPLEGGDLRLLGIDGGWRRVDGTAEAVTGTLHDMVRPSLAADGKLVAMSTDAGILVVDVTTGKRQLIDWTKKLAEPQDMLPELLWLPDGTGIVVLHWTGPWSVGLDGTTTQLPYEHDEWGSSAVLAIDPDGTVVVKRFKERDLVLWRDGEQVGGTRFEYFGERPAAGFGRFALSGWGNDLPKDGGPLVVDQSTGELVAYLPIKDPNSVYTDNGHLTPLGFLDADTVVLSVAPMDFKTMEIGEETWQLVSWNFVTGELRRLTSGAIPMWHHASVAIDALGMR